MDNVYLRKAFNTVSHNGPTDKVMKYGLVSGHRDGLKLSELLGSKGSDQQSKVQLEASH